MKTSVQINRGIESLFGTRDENIRVLESGLNVCTHLVDNQIEIVPFDETQVRAAAGAFDRYGKGVGPKARLNLADCAAYALAITMNCPLLFKGDDFTETDVKVCF